MLSGLATEERQRISSLVGLLEKQVQALRSGKRVVTVDSFQSQRMLWVGQRRDEATTGLSLVELSARDQ
jgi:hypothetical protein